MKGQFIVFEGPDGSGKSTQIRMLNEYFRTQKPELFWNTFFTREPGGLGVKLCEDVRNILLDPASDICDEAEAYLYAASRAQHVKKIKELLAQGHNVICDRYYYSSLVYQGVGRKLGVGPVKRINELAIQDLKPDMVFYISVDFDTCIKRKNDRASLDRLEQSDDSFFKDILLGYDIVFKMLNLDETVIEISTVNKTPEETHKEIIEYFK